MTILYSATTNSFYDDGINPVIPTDAIVISQEKYEALMDGQCNGKNISHDEEGNPILIDPPPLPVPVLLENCKLEAKIKLEQTDWSQTADIGELLLNQADFTAYRAKIREVYFNPVPNPIWAEEPKAVWKA